MRRRTNTEYPAANYQPQQIITMADVERYRAAAKGYWELSRSRLAVIRVLAVLLIATAVAVGTMFATGQVKLKGTQAPATVTAFELKNIGKLATQAGYYSTMQTVKVNREGEILGWKIKVPFTEGTYIISYSGVVKAGLEFGDIEISVDENEKIITLKMPKVEILSNTLDEDKTQFLKGSENMFSQMDDKIGNEVRKNAKDTARQTALDNGIIGEAKQNAEALIRKFLSGSYNMEEYYVDFRWPVTEGEES